MTPTENINLAVRQFGESLPKGAKVLDVGCGRRPYESCFSQCEYLGVDVEVSGREEGDKRADVFFDGLDLPFEDQRFDAILCTEVLEHAIDPARLTREMKRVLKPSGKVLITVPFMWGEHETPYDFRRFSTFGLRRLLDEAGLEIVTSDKLTAGIDAINALVQSEIVNFDVHYAKPARSTAARLLRRITVTLARKTWDLQLQLWRRLYRFERIYIDNVILAARRD